MPRRKFAVRNGSVVEITNEEEKAKCDEISADVASRSEPLDFGSGISTRRASPGTWPRLSDSLGCNPRHIKDDQEYLAKHGVYTEYTKDGRAILRDQQHANAHMAAFNYVDPDACYSQRAPTKFTTEEWKRVSRR